MVWHSSNATRNPGSVTISIVLEHVLLRQQLSVMLVASKFQVYEFQVLKNCPQQCHKKPKFQAYNYCSKHCASIAMAGNSAKANHPVANSSISRKGASGNKPAATSMDPVQIARRW